IITLPEFEMFIRKQLSPLMNQGTPFDQIPFFMDFQYYLRHECSMWEEQKAANEKLQKLNYLLTHRIGLDVSIPMFQVCQTRPNFSIEDDRQRGENEELRSSQEEENKHRQKGNINTCCLCRNSKSCIIL
ncbi:Hypothetical predicted protein, partial [Mytilus galloprovincialis]